MNYGTCRYEAQDAHEAGEAPHGQDDEALEDGDEAQVLRCFE